MGGIENNRLQKKRKGFSPQATEKERNSINFIYFLS